MTNKSSLTKQEIVALARFLRKLQWPLPYPIFLALCKSVPMVTVYCAAMPDPKHLSLVYRKDEFFDNWCVPGSILYYGESTDAALDRVIKNKIGVKLKEIRFVGYYESHDARERGIRLLFVGKPTGIVRHGQVFSTYRLPKKFLRDHMPGIRMIRALTQIS